MRTSENRGFPLIELGFSLIELIVALGVTVIVGAAIFDLVGQARRRFDTEPDVADRQQRIRVSVEALSRDLLMASAVLPYRAAGALPDAEILKQLGTGLYISNLWYLNYSDQPGARMTGMTRFATFWVENGEIQAPVSTMRFDDSAYSLLGSQLEALTEERELMLSASTYRRS